MSSEKYELAQDEYDLILEKIDTLLTKSKKNTNRDETKLTINRIWSHIDEAKSLIDEMEFEARSAPLGFKSEMMSNVRQKREMIAKITRQLRAASNDINNRIASNPHFHHHRDQPGSETNQQQQQVNRGIRILEETSNSIYRSQQVAQETEDVGHEIIQDLETQRESLERARDRLQETDAEITKSRQIVRRLYFGVIQNKIVLILIILIQLGIIGCITYWKFFKK